MAARAYGTASRLCLLTVHRLQFHRRFVSSIQQAFQSNMGVGESHSANAVLPYKANCSLADDALSDDLAMEGHTINLPAPALGKLPEIETSMRMFSTTAHGRDSLAKFVMADDYIGKLIPLVEEAEDFESLSDLHSLCNIMKTIILLNDTAIIEHAVTDENVLGVVGALEYDPDFPSHKANHRHWLDTEGRYKEVVPIEDEITRRKIHQTYRLQYLKDVVLARILDDPTFSVLNSLIFFNQVEIVQYLQSNAAFLGELFGIFSWPQPDAKKKKEAVLFIQQCCAIAKNIQPPARASLYNNFIAHGLLQVIHFGLRHSDVSVRVGATDILISIIDHDPQMIRQTIYRQMHEDQPSLTESLIDLLLVEVDLGVKSQISEALKVLLDHGPTAAQVAESMKNNGEMPLRIRPGQGTDPQQELFLTKFYEDSATKLFKPLMDLENRTDMGFPAQQASMFSYLIEILCFFIRQHHRFSRYFVMNNNLVERITQLLQCPEKYLQLVAIRFFRALIGMQEEFYVKHLVEKKVLGPILQVLMATLPRDNLLSSAALELFEFIKKENLKDLVKHLVDTHREDLESLSYLSTFRDLVLRYDQTQGFTVNMDHFLEGEDDVRRPPPNMRLMDQIAVDPQEEEYWETEEADDEHEEHPEVKVVPSNGPIRQTKPLVDYPSDEEADEAVIDAEGNDTPDVDPQGSANVADDAEKAEPTEQAALEAENGDASPPERLSEKRRREEDEDDDELNKLMANKRRNSSSSDANSIASSKLGQRRRTSFTGSNGSSSKRISINLSPAVKSGGNSRSDDES